MHEQSQRAFRSFYDLFASGMTTADVERLIKVDTCGMYEFYSRHMPKPAGFRRGAELRDDTTIVIIKRRE